jgi:hypothetical protein
VRRAPTGSRLIAPAMTPPNQPMRDENPYQRRAFSFLLRRASSSSLHIAAARSRAIAGKFFIARLRR